jgi:hypothetical protein
MSEFISIITAFIAMYFFFSVILFLESVGIPFVIGFFITIGILYVIEDLLDWCLKIGVRD